MYITSTHIFLQIRTQQLVDKFLYWVCKIEYIILVALNTIVISQPKKNKLIGEPNIFPNIQLCKARNILCIMISSVYRILFQI